MRIAQNVAALEPYVPGEQPRDAGAVKLNTNENPYPPSPRVSEALRAFDPASLRRYPDPLFRALRARIAEIHGTAPERVFVGNGSDEILTLCTRTFVENDGAAAAFAPSYSLYRTLAAMRGVRFEEIPLPEDFSWTDPGDARGASLFFLANPNAPTSVAYPPEEVARFAARFPGTLVIDEAYADFSGATCAGIAAAPGNANTIVMRTLSKSFSLAGLRVGYCIGPADLVEALYKMKDSYNVDAVAQALALAALEDLPWMRANAAKIAAERARMSAELRARGWDVPESSANFIFARPAHRPAAEIFAALRGRAIYVRYFPGPRTGDRLRITVGTPAQDDALMDALREIDKA